MKVFLYAACIFLASCSADNTAKTEIAGKLTHVKDSAQLTKESELNISEDDEYEDETEIYYIVIADTGLQYFPLHEKMFNLQKHLNLEIDTFGRYFDVLKNRIILPETDEDEMYAGEYFPRRFESNSLSLEYLDVYKDHSAENTMALVAGIYENETSADSALQIIGKYAPNAFKTRTEMYVGCMH